MQVRARRLQELNTSYMMSRTARSASSYHQAYICASHRNHWVKNYISGDSAQFDDFECGRYGQLNACALAIQTVVLQGQTLMTERNMTI
jgi:hypothetical protein